MKIETVAKKVTQTQGQNRTMRIQMTMICRAEQVHKNVYYKYLTIEFCHEI